LLTWFLITLSGTAAEPDSGSSGWSCPVFSKDSLAEKSLPVPNKNQVNPWDTLYTDKPLKSPVKVMVKSLIIPGWGQWDNNKKLKAAAFLVVESGLFYQIHYHNKRYHSTGDRDYLARRKEYTWVLSVIHLYCVLDAVTDAYLYRFDDIMNEKNGISLWRDENTYWAGAYFSF